MERDSAYFEGLFLRGLPLSWHPKCNVRLTGHGHQLRSIQVRCLDKPEEDCVGLLVAVDQALLRSSTFGLIVYGGVCPDLGNVLGNALQEEFNAALNLHSWSKVGMIRYTKK
jgi:hypothetical protein